MKYFVKVGKTAYREIEVNFTMPDIEYWAMKNEDNIFGATLSVSDKAFGWTYELSDKQESTAPAVLEAAWVRALELLVTIKVTTIETRETPLGTLRAQVGGDPDYPEIFTYLKRKDAEEIDVTAAEVKDDGIKVFNYLDTLSDGYTDEYLLTKDELLVKFD